MKNHDDYEARSELMWASSMAENGILKIGKTTDFQAHQIEHQLGAYTDCNHGQGLAVIHPVLYRHIYKDGVERFAASPKMFGGLRIRETMRQPHLQESRPLRTLSRKWDCPPASRKWGFQRTPISVRLRIPQTSPQAAAKSSATMRFTRY